jgi:hypothetical protein
MLKKLVFAILFLGSLFALAALAGERVANAYKTTKLTNTSVLVSCQDEREPRISRLDETSTAIVVTCKQ